MIIGVAPAIQYHGDLAPALVEYIDGDSVRRIAAFVGIVIGTAVATRIAAMLVRSLLSMLFLGWVDRVAGALAGAAVALVLLGTALYFLGGVDITSLREVLQASTLALRVSQILLVSVPAPWCSQLRDALGVPEGETPKRGTAPQPDSYGSSECINLMSLAKSFLGSTVTEKLAGFLGHDLKTIVGVVKVSLSGSAEEMTNLAQEGFGTGDRGVE